MDRSSTVVPVSKPKAVSVSNPVLSTGKVNKLDTIVKTIPVVLLNYFDVPGGY